MQLNGSQIFVEVLCEQGVDTLFGYPGGAVLNLYDELYKNSDRITHVLTAHEQGAAHAADGYARATGRTGVVLATSGPGATNLVTGIATAYMDSVPMVAFTGNIATTGLGKDGFQEAYIEGITMPITKHNFTVRRVEELADTMRSAFRIAQSGRKGPVLVDIPKDVTAAVCEFTPKKPEPIRTVTTFNAEQVKWAADLINAAQRPLVYFGGGVRSAAGGGAHLFGSSAVRCGQCGDDPLRRSSTRGGGAASGVYDLPAGRRLRWANAARCIRLCARGTGAAARADGALGAVFGRAVHRRNHLRGAVLGGL